MSFHALTHLSYSPISDSSINEPPVKPRIPVKLSGYSGDVCRSVRL